MKIVLQSCECWGPRGGVAEDSSLLGRDALSSGKWFPTFRSARSTNDTASRPICLQFLYHSVHSKVNAGLCVARFRNMHAYNIVVHSTCPISTRGNQLYWGVSIYALSNSYIVPVFVHRSLWWYIKGGKVKVKCTLVQALRLCTGRTAHRGSRGIALLIHDHGTRRG